MSKLSSNPVNCRIQIHKKNVYIKRKQIIPCFNNFEWKSENIEKKQYLRIKVYSITGYSTYAVKVLISIFKLLATYLSQINW